jgi:hypothetical protein
VLVTLLLTHAAGWPGVQRMRGGRGLTACTGPLPAQVSERGRGVGAIAAMVNVTRLHNAAAACSYMRRVTALCKARASGPSQAARSQSQAVCCCGAGGRHAPFPLNSAAGWWPPSSFPPLQDYARRRVAFGRPLAAQPLALATLALLELRSCGCLALMLEVACLLGGWGGVGWGRGRDGEVFSAGGMGAWKLLGCRLLPQTAAGPAGAHSNTSPGLAAAPRAIP